MNTLSLRSVTKHNSRPRSRQLTVERLEDRSLMAVADLVAYRPVNQYINYAQYPVAEAVETDPKLGPGIRVNGDDDNVNGQADFLDNATSAAGDNDLVRVDVGVSGGTLAWTGDLRVWTSATKGASVSVNSPVLPSQSLWVEYASSVHTVGASAALTLTVSDGLGTSTDSVVFHSFQSIVIAIGGNSQDPRNFGDSRLGVYTIGGTLYGQGYDVHLYAHGDVQSTGKGAAYNEVVNAVLKRNVDNVAIYGYSWGGGATYELSAGLKANTALAPAGYKLQYTAYLDGIRHGSLSAETRKPLLTAYHDNIFQRKDWLLKGNKVSGATNLNVTSTTWGKSLAHTTLDDNATVQGTIVGNLKTKLLNA